MSLAPFVVTFELDGAGVVWNPAEPIMLDGLLAFCLSAIHIPPERRHIERDDEPAEVPLPLGQWRRGGAWGWQASALFPDKAAVESIGFWRKRFRSEPGSRHSSGSPNLTNGVYREYNAPLPILCVRRLQACAQGNRKEVLRLLERNIRRVGHKRGHGFGNVVAIRAEWTDQDWSLEREGLATRWLPQEGAARLVRPRPPYWNTCGRVPCCEIGSARLETSQ